MELDCEVVVKTTKVEGVFDKDPAKHSDAVKLGALDFQRAVEDENIMVMDKAAMGLAMEHNMPLVICSLEPSGNIAKVAKGTPVGTRIG